MKPLRTGLRERGPCPTMKPSPLPSKLPARFPALMITALCMAILNRQTSCSLDAEALRPMESVVSPSIRAWSLQILVWHASTRSSGHVSSQVQPARACLAALWPTWPRSNWKVGQSLQPLIFTLSALSFSKWSRDNEHFLPAICWLA